MYKHILIAADGSELAQKAVDHGLALAKAIGAATTAVYVTAPWTGVAMGEVVITLPPDNYDQIVQDSANGILAGVATAAKAAGVTCQTLHVSDRLPAEGIMEAAANSHADLIVMSSHGRSGLVRLFLGSEANEVVSKSTIPVLICR